MDPRRLFSKVTWVSIWSSRIHHHIHRIHRIHRVHRVHRIHRIHRPYRYYRYYRSQRIHRPYRYSRSHYSPYEPTLASLQRAVVLASSLEPHIFPWRWYRRSEHGLIAPKVASADILFSNQIFLGVEYSRFIAAKFTWEPSGGLLDLVLCPGNPVVLGQFKLRMTLLKHCALPDANTNANRYQINEALLTDDAFLPKTFTVTLTQGRFFSPYDELGEGKTTPITKPYALQLSFDPSPYPPESEWTENKGTSGGKANRVWHWNKFCARESRE